MFTTKGGRMREKESDKSVAANNMAATLCNQIQAAIPSIMKTIITAAGIVVVTNCSTLSRTKKSARFPRC